MDNWFALGNDLVWLADPKNAGRSDDRRLLQRVLTPAERLLVRVSADPDRMLWSLWAAKEAAFKAFSQGNPGVVFSPRSFEVIPQPTRGTALVRREDWTLPVVWKQGPDWVHALACPVSATVQIEATPPEGKPGPAGDSHAVRALAVKALVAAGLPPGAVVGRPPRYSVDGVDQGVTLSLSHDGPWVAVAFLLPSHPV